MKLLSSALVMIGLLASSPILMAAQKYPTVALNADQKRSLQKINAFMNSYQSLKSDFTQISSKGQTAQGTLLVAGANHRPRGTAFIVFDTKGFPHPRQHPYTNDNEGLR